MDRMQLVPRWAAALMMAAGLGVSLSLIGCGDSSSDDFRTISEGEAAAIDEAREQVHAKALAKQNQADGIVPSSSPAVDKASSLLKAAKLAAQAVRSSSEKAPADRDPLAERAEFFQNARPGFAAMARAMKSLPDVAGRKAAAAIEGTQLIREITLLVPEKSFTIEGPEQAVRVSYDDFDLLKILNMEPVPVDAVEHFPHWLKELDGRRIRVRGFMFPTFIDSGITRFTLARDNQICCFGRNPKVYDLVQTTLRKGEMTDYIQGRPFDVVGTFYIRPEADDDELWNLFEIEDAIVVDE